MASNREDTLKQFCDVTGADEDRSRFFLESSNWQLEVALSSFYENGGNLDDVPAPAPNNPVLSPPPISVGSDSDMESPPGSPVKPVKPVKPLKMDKNTKNASNQRFATLSSLQGETSSDEEEGQAFYAGGSERSGQQIIGPGKHRRDIVTDMFKSVQERGGIVLEDDHQSSSSRGPFGGTGYRLGQTADDHETVASNNPQSQEIRSVRLRLYREGFSVDNGSMRRYDDPDNAEFLNCVRRGEIPRELSSGGTEVRVSLEDRRHEDAPRATPGAGGRPFLGKGQMLGSPTPATVGATAPVAAAPADREANERHAQAQVGLDDSQPTTTIQFRLADGSRLTGRFNHSHTVATLRQYLTTAVPTYQLQSFILQTTFPSAELTDPEATLIDAKLLNSVVVQRLK